MSIQVVSNFLRKSKDKKMLSGSQQPKKTLKQCLLELKDFIDDTINEFLASQTYSESEIAQWIYKDSVGKGEIEDNVKVNLFAARRTLNKIINEISHRKGGLNYHNIKLYSNLLNDYLFDINDFINYYKRKTDHNFIFLTGGKSYSTSSFETFSVAKGLFYNSLIKKNPIPYKESQGMVSMTLRQSIEIKTKRIFGIYKIKKARRNAPDYGFKRIFDFIEANNSDIEYNPIDFEILKLIYKWSCAYIHNGEISYLWQTENALAYLNTYFKPGSHSGRNVMSIYGAFKLSNFNSLRSRLNSFIGPDYIIEYIPNNVAEAIIVNL